MDHGHNADPFDWNFQRIMSRSIKICRALISSAPDPCLAYCTNDSVSFGRCLPGGYHQFNRPHCYQIFGDGLVAPRVISPYLFFGHYPYAGNSLNRLLRQWLSSVVDAAVPCEGFL